MMNVLKHGSRISFGKIFNQQIGKNLVAPKVNFNILKSSYSRTLWHMCSSSKFNEDFLKPKPLNELCQCGCSGLIHTGGENDLADFLKEEIAQEKKALKMKNLPAEVNGFTVSADHAELVFEKKNQFETIIVTMNVNHSVDTDESPDDDGMGDMRSKPSFDVDIVRNKKTLSFSCSFTNFQDAAESESADLYQINDVTYFEEDWNDKTYSVAADILDENLYDLFMVVLNEKGITKRFVEKMSDVATSHEHLQYINLLENVKKFSSAN